MSNSFSENHTYKAMTLSGHGQVSPVPNIATIRLGVQSSGENLIQIQSENAQKIQSILQALKQIGVSDIKTFQYSIDKIYDYQNGNRIDKGYSVRNILEIKTTDLDKTGIIIDTAVNNGANAVELISFDVSNSEFYYQQALNLAVSNAIQKSKSISMNLGIKSTPLPVHIIENSTQPAPQQQFFREAVTTPIVPGNIQIQASVTVEFSY